MKDHNPLLKNILVASLFFLNASVFAELVQLNEKTIDTEFANSDMASRNLISKVEQEAKSPWEVQVKNHEELANTQSDDFKKFVLEFNAVSDQEQKKRTDAETIRRDSKQLEIEPHQVRPRYVYFNNDPNITIYMNYPESKNLKN